MFSSLSSFTCYPLIFAAREAARIAHFLPPESVSETQSFITEPITALKSSSAKPTAPKANTGIPVLSSAASSRRASDASQKRTETLETGKDDETMPLQPSLDGLIVREEKRVSVSWSRDASPAPHKDGAGNSPHRSLESSYNEKLKEAEVLDEESEEKENEDAVAVADMSKGARRKTTTLKSSHISRKEAGRMETTAVTAKVDSKQEKNELEERPPSKALLQKLAMVEAEPRQKFVPPADMLNALKTINNSLLKKIDAKSLSAASLKSSKLVIQQEWFRVSSTEKANPHEVEDYLDCFEEMSVALWSTVSIWWMLMWGNTAMHYAVSHGNFDVVSILLDSKVCNVNQMNNAGYTCVMLVSLAKLKNAAHRTVVQRLFQMADVNIRAKKHCQTALMLAVSHGNNEMVELLLAAGADINIQDEDGSTALMCAAEHGRTDIVKHLLSQPDCDSLIVDVDGATAFKIAWQAGHRDLVSCCTCMSKCCAASNRTVVMLRESRWNCRVAQSLRSEVLSECRSKRLEIFCNLSKN
ncbi:unnamed protein product [Ceratitis capitata]|uniref:(Mediterranean fruit fly) hypothetical protein n=1 Tax=Ceratitis capitata TaxID=7213 RepID=A0A811VAC8_CERCA|nr:unnamed protein product [Ceratitis capitata]